MTDGGADGGLMQESEIITVNGSDWEIAAAQTGSGAVHDSATASVVGNSITWTGTCPMSSPLMLTYTASGATLSLYTTLFGFEVVDLTFMKQ
jgi:hypothetical protein